MFASPAKSAFKRKPSAQSIQSSSKPSKLHKHDSSSDLNASNSPNLQNGVLSSNFNIQKSRQLSSKEISKGLKLYDSDALSLEYETKFPARINSRTGTSFIDADTGFMAIVDQDSCYVWNYKAHTGRKAEPVLYNLRIPKTSTASKQSPFFDFVGVYEDNEKYKSKLDIGAILCTTAGSIFFWDRIKYVITGIEKSRSINLTLSPNEHVVSFISKSDASEYTAISNLGNAFHLEIKPENNERKVSLLSTQNVSHAGFASKAASMFSSITKKIAGYSSGSTFSNLSNEFKTFKLIRASHTTPTIGNSASPTLAMVTENSVEKWSYSIKHAAGHLEHLSNINLRDIIQSSREFTNINVTIEEISDAYFLPSTEQLAVLTKVISQNKAIDYVFSLVNTNGIATNVRTVFLNHFTCTQNPTFSPRLLYSDDLTVFFIVFDTAFYSIAHYSPSSTSLESEDQLVLNKISFRQNHKVSGTSKLFRLNSRYQITLALKNGAGILNLFFDKASCRKTSLNMSNQGFVKNHFCQVVNFGHLGYSYYTSNNPVSFDLADYISVKDFSIRMLQDAAITISNLIVKNDSTNFKFSSDLTTNLDERISSCHNLHRYLSVEGLITQFSNESKVDLMNNAEKLLAASDLWQYIEYSAGQLSPADNSAQTHVADIVFDVAKQSSHSYSASQPSIESFFFNNNNQIDAIFPKLVSSLKKISQTRHTNCQSASLLSHVNRTFLALVSSSLAYRLEFGTKLYSVPQYYLFKNWWGRELTRSDLFRLSMELFNASFTIIKTFKVSLLPDMNIAKNNSKLVDFSDTLLKSGLPVLKVDYERVDYCNLLENGFYEDLQLSFDTHLLNSHNSESDTVSNAKPTSSFKSNINANSNANSNTNAYNNNINFRSDSSYTNSSGDSQVGEQQLFVDQLVLFAQICFIICPNQEAVAADNTDLQDNLSNMLFKLVQTGNIGTSIRLSMKLEYYEFVIKILLLTENFISIVGLSLQDLFDSCAAKYGHRFTKPLLENYSRFGKFYSLLAFPNSNVNRENIKNSDDIGNDGITGETNLEKLDSLKRFYATLEDESDPAQKFKWIYDLSIYNYSSAYESLSNNVLNGSKGDCSSLNSSINMLSIAKLVHLAKLKKPLDLQDYSGQETQNLGQNRGKAQGEPISLSAIDSLLNMNKLVLRFLNALKLRHPLSQRKLLGSQTALFDIADMCSSTTNAKFRRDLKSVYNSYKFAVTKISKGKALNVFEFICIVLYVTFPERQSKILPDSSFNSGKQKFTKDSERTQNAKLGAGAGAGAGAGFNQDMSDEEEFWGIPNKIVLVAKLICGLEWLVPFKNKYKNKNKNKMPRLKANLFALLWMNVYLLDDWKRIDLLDERSIDHILTSTSLFSVLSALKQQQQDLLGTFLSPSSITLGFSDLVFDDRDHINTHNHDQENDKTGDSSTEFEIYEQASVLFDGYQTVFGQFDLLVKNSRLKEHVEQVLSLI